MGAPSSTLQVRGGTINTGGGDLVAENKAVVNSEKTESATAKGQAKTIVLLIHGIRTRAWWQKNVASIIEARTGATVIPLKYSYFDLFRFLCPFGFCRNGPIERLRKQMEGVREQYKECRIIVFAHSYGTYALSRILLDNPYFTFHRIILCGSIIPEDYDWRRVDNQILSPNKRDAIINECGIKDVWPVIARSATWGYGASGTYGFGTFNVRDRYHQNKHSDFFNEKFVYDFWIPAVLGTPIDFSETDKASETTPAWFAVFRFPIRWFLLTVGACTMLLFVLWGIQSSHRFAGWLHPPSSSTTQSAELSRARTQSFSDFFSSFANRGLIPIVRPGAQEVGAVYNPANGRWIYEAATCFPTLKPKPAVSSALTSVVINSPKNASIALGLDKVLSVPVGLQVQSVTLVFSDVTVQDIPEHALREAYSPKACPELQTILDSVASGQPPATNATPPLLILGAIYRAKRTATIEVSADASASGPLEAMIRSLPVKGNVKSDAGGSLSVKLENDVILPVAAAPAFILAPTGLTLGPGQPSTKMVWMPFDPSLNPDAIESFKQIAKPPS